MYRKKNMLRVLPHLTRVVRTAGVKLRCLAHSKLKKTSLTKRSAWSLRKNRLSGMLMKLYVLHMTVFLSPRFKCFGYSSDEDSVELHDR